MIILLKADRKYGFIWITTRPAHNFPRDSISRAGNITGNITRNIKLHYVINDILE